MNEIMKIGKLYMLMPFVFSVGVCLQNSVLIYVEIFNYKLRNFGNPRAVILNEHVYGISILFNYDACAIVLNLLACLDFPKSMVGSWSKTFNHCSL